jgi:hypothetical protein
MPKAKAKSKPTAKPKPKSAAEKPRSVRVRSYQVGFGDCFLLTFSYPPGGKVGQRHVLIDFGSTGQPDDVSDSLLHDVAKDIEKTTAGKLHAVVATHRHRDHISGFATDTSKAPGKIIAALKPDVVVQPWTEDPDAQPDARKATTLTRKRSKGFVAALADMNAFAGHALDELRQHPDSFGKRLSKELCFLGQDNLANRSAVDNLMNMGDTNYYVHFGSKSGLEDVLPGVNVTVLGPPTLEQSEAIAKQRSEDANEFWHFQAAAGRRFTAAAKGPFPKSAAYAPGSYPPHANWFVKKLNLVRGDQLLQLVRELDKQMNNTSVILLFEAGSKKLLFPGDAQIENWSYALNTASNHDAIRKLLADVDFYKVGHHGSLNATPKTLWNLFKHRSTNAAAPERLKSVVSTMAGKHGNPKTGTEVPRSKLVTALKSDTSFLSTQTLKGKNLFHEVVIPFS